MLFEQRSPRIERLAHDVSPSQHQHIKGVVNKLRLGRSVALKQAEGWSPLLIKCYDFAIDYSFVRHCCEGFCNVPIAPAEVAIITRTELHLAAALNGERPIPI